jgi:hypothetical protein
LALFFAPASRAASIVHGNFSGTTVDYLQVTESSITDPVPLFGAPTPAGDALAFNPTSFGSSSSGAGGADTTDGQLTCDIMSKSGFAIHKIIFNEAGDYTLNGAGGTTNTNANVGASFFMQVVELNGVSVAPILLFGNMTFAPSGGTFDFVNDPHGPAAIWTGNATFDIDALLAAQSVVGQATKIRFSMDNVLTTSSEAGTSALIKKKVTNGVTITVDTNVPEPTSLAIFALGGIAIFGRRNLRNDKSN